MRSPLQARRAGQLRERKSSLCFIESKLFFQFAERNQHHRLAFPVVCLEQRRQNKVIRLPCPARFVCICRSSRNADQRFPRKRVYWFAPAALLDRSQSPLLKIKGTTVRIRKI